MKKLQIGLLFFVFLSCGEDDDTVPQPLPLPACLEVTCETEDDFFGKMIMNGECWMADFTSLNLSPGGKFSIGLDKYDVNDVGEGLSISLRSNANLEDTLWIGFTNSGNPASDVATAYYSYRGIDASLGAFSFEFGAELTYTDYLLIDYFNADTSIMEGRFQVRFPRRGVSSFANAPDSMRLGCGSFRVKRE